MPRVRVPGEPWVWFTAVGLTLGLAMILGLLGLVLVEGLRAFWPRRVWELTLRPAGEGAAPVRLVGERVRDREKAGVLPSAVGAKPVPREWQMFLGNKEVYGQSFRYVDVADIAEVRLARGILRFERTEYGPLLAYPVAVEVPGMEPLTAEHPEFFTTLDRLLEEARQRRLEIRRLEKREIGRINREMESLHLELRRWEVQGGPPGPADEAWQQLTQRLARLEARYQTLADRARVLRQAQERDQLVCRLPDGRELRVPVGRLLAWYAPNELGFRGRLRVFASRVWEFLTEEPREANTEGGIFPAIFGTFVMTVLMSLAVTPFGVLAAVYLREYARQGWFTRAVRIAVNNLAGVPSIVFGVFGLGFFVYFLGGQVDRLFFAERLPTPTFGTGGLLWASLTLALMTVPVVVVATEEALAAVPRSVREGSLACGASRWQTIQRVVLPAAAPGILTGLILAMARGAGEVAPLMLVGVVKLAPELPINTTYPYIHLDQKFMHLGFHIYDLGFQSPDSDAAQPMVFATTLFLLALVITLNLTAIGIRNHLRRKYASSAF
ncbi:phosphate ABC transporter permease PstA [Limisphaera ngatamarikiensis]|uniref:Phosphate transport system permease protein PstA n=2 Tax=Limisphaera ngatamarikiensis TaxID=1324935 RepID=A0A6M1RTE0_9BACT|nr:phosphate ABC transporter permease PstA [Limisphaera ngatamarikiensis]